MGTSRILLGRHKRRSPLLKPQQSSQRYNQKQISARIKSARDALPEAHRTPGPGNPIHFLDGNKIATWTNQHAAAMAHVWKCCQLPSVGALRTWRDWSREPGFEQTFHSNAILDGFMQSLRAHLIKPSATGRITGYSGLGKTRLGLETLRPPSDSADMAQAVLSYSTGYMDAAQSADATAIVSRLEIANIRGLIVVDNCPTQLHYELEKIIRRTGCQLSLLTMDYEPGSSIADALHIELEPAMMQDVIPRILKELPQAAKLSDQQVQYIAGFASGFPQIAVLMAEAGDTLNLETLNQKGLAEKILWGHAPPNERARTVISAISIFTHVGFDAARAAQKVFVRDILCRKLSLDDRELSQLLRPFERRRILQNAGDYRFVTPIPLAVALAAEWWEHASSEELTPLLPQIEAAGLTDFFCRRTEQLHFSPKAAALAAQLCGADGPLCDAEVLNSELGSQLFRAFVELNPASAVGCLWHVFSEMDLESLTEVSAGRRNLIWALEKLCWESELFPKAAALLLRFAAAENETWANNATGQFKQLFQVFLSGTQAPLTERVALIDENIASEDASIRRICIAALGVGLQSDRFSRSGGVEVRGSGLPREDYRPKNNLEIADYWHRCWQLLTAVALKGSEDSPIALAELGENIRTIVCSGLSARFEPEFRRLADATNHYWPEALVSINSI